MTLVEDEAGFRALLEQVAGARGFSCANYKDGCLRRRIAVRMRACGVATYRDYAAMLTRDATEYDRLIEVLTINVTRLYRDAEVWDAFAERVLPVLWELGGPRFVAWSAACSSGEELYTLAALLHRHAERTGTLRRLAQTEVIGTDIDDPSLRKAARGVYAEADFTEVPAPLRQRYFRPQVEEGATVHAAVPELRTMVRTQHRDLLSESAPATGLQLITCRNVMIYFDRKSQEPLLQRFHDALLPGGVLVLGKVETLIGPSRALFEVVDQRQRIFRRPVAA
jgi:chemotaxis methyl-accepting protein methylase